MTVYEIIERSVQMHPTLFAAQLEAHSITHRQYAASQAYKPDLAAIALGMATTCDNAILNVAKGDTHAIVTDFSQMITALNVAGRLQCLPRHVMDDAVAAISAVYDRSE